jgi:hypothetical protein
LKPRTCFVPTSASFPAEPRYGYTRACSFTPDFGTTALKSLPSCTTPNPVVDFYLLVFSAFPTTTVNSNCGRLAHVRTRARLDPQTHSQRHRAMVPRAPSREALSLLKHTIRPAAARSQASCRLLSSTSRPTPVPRTQRTNTAHQTTRSAATFTHSHHAEAVSIIPTAVDTSSADFKENRRQMEEATENLVSLHSKIAQGGPQRNRDKHIQRGKMLVRDRVTALIDPGTPFLELSQMAGYDMYQGEDVPAGGIVTGIGTVNGVQCMIVANDATVKGGTYYPVTVKKHLRAQTIAQENRLPCIYGRSKPSEPSRRLSGCQPLWSHLLQPSAHVGHGNTTDQRSHGALHGWRCICA